MPGDINNQDNINNADAQWLLEHLAQKTGKQSGTEQGYTLEQFKEQCKVVNPSGTVFSCADASYIYSHVKEQGSATNYPITLPEPEPEPGNGGFQFTDINALRNAVNLWINDKSSAINTYGEINTWDTSLMTNMSNVFYNKSFNDDISNWNTSNVTNMRNMFRASFTFNQPIKTQQVTVNNVTYTAWDVSKVTRMESMFKDAQDFNQEIGNWDVSNVTNMNSMFFYADAFNQPINTQQVTVNNVTYTAWDVSKVTNMYEMFAYADSFNQPIDSWEVSNVTTMYRLFISADVFNQSISNWDVSNVTTMYQMFRKAFVFNQEIRNWDVSSVTMFDDMFTDATLMNASPWNAPTTPDASWFNQ